MPDIFWHWQSWVALPKHLLALMGIFFAFVVAEEKFSIEELDCNHSEDEMEEEVNDLLTML
jgi:hypothetical protein